MIIPVGAQNVSTNEIRVLTPLGIPVAGLTSADFQLWYRSDGGVIPLTLVDLSSPSDSYSVGGIISLGDGWYRLDLPDIFEPNAHTILVGGNVVGHNYVVLTAPINVVNTHSGFGTHYVNHNYGGADNLLVVDPDGSPQGGVLITAFLKTDWDAGNRSNVYNRGQTTTLQDGRWQTGLMLPLGDIVLTFSKINFHLKNRTITVV